jgi:hypothetical protein
VAVACFNYYAGKFAYRLEKIIIVQKFQFYRKISGKDNFCPKCLYRLWGPPSLVFNGYWGALFTGGKQQGCVAAQSLPSHAEFKNDWSYTCTSHIPSLLKGKNSDV